MALIMPGMEQFERIVLRQNPAIEPWTPVTDYSLETRREIEGLHPHLIKEVFRPAFAFDVGCGPDEILCRLLRDIGVHAKGMDPQGKPAPEQPWRGNILHIGEMSLMADLVICREVLEHLTLLQIRRAVTNLCALSSQYLYITTRFSSEHDILRVETSDSLDPTHISICSKDLLRLLITLEGFRRRADLEEKMDWRHLNRCLVYERAV